MLAWAELSFGPFAEQARGIDGWEGKAAIAGGVVMLTPGIRRLAGTTAAGLRLRAALVGGLIAAGVGVYTALTVNDQLLDAAEEAQVPAAVVREAIASGALRVSLEAGVFVVIVGGVLGVLAGALAFGPRGDVAPPPAARAGSGGLTGWAAPGPVGAEGAGLTGWAAPGPTSAGGAGAPPERPMPERPADEGTGSRA
ncbi:MAG TPA: hypothetical protein VF029_00035 [Actinomycetota bacterium]